MQAKTFPENYVGKAGYGTIRWESDNTGVATVGINNGIVDCKSEGEANITVTYNDGRQSRNPKDKLPTKTVKINVKKKAATSKSSLPEAPRSPSTQEKGVRYYTDSNRWNVINVAGSYAPKWTGTSYPSLTVDQIEELAYLAYLEQSSLCGATMELSLMGNLADKYGYSNVYDYVSQNGTDEGSWFGPVNTKEYKNIHYKLEEIEDEEQREKCRAYKSVRLLYRRLVYEVLIEGTRYLPPYVDEHDCIEDIEYISTGDKNNMADYIPNKTLIHTKYAYDEDGNPTPPYTFIGFAPDGGDPFGYYSKDTEKTISDTTVYDIKPREDIDIKKIPQRAKATRAELVEFLNKQIGKNGELVQKNFRVNTSTNWCCYFLGYCIDAILGDKSSQYKIGFTNNDDGVDEHADDAGDIARAAMSKGIFHRYGDGYIPKPGDVLIISTQEDADDNRTHVGFVTHTDVSRNGMIFTTVEGNTKDPKPEYSITSRYVRTQYKVGDDEDSLEEYTTGNQVEPGMIYGFVDLSQWFTD